MDSARNTANEATEPVAGERGAGTLSDPYDAGNRNDGTTTAENRGASSSYNSENRAENLDAPTNADTGAAAPESGGARYQKQQGADRPTEYPDREEEGAIRETKDNAESTMRRDTDEGSGETGGSYGGDSKEYGGDSKEDDGGMGTGGSGSAEKGTGEQWVKSSGMAADGGDFDASKPGAGREADRLLEEAGVHHEGNTGPPQETGKSTAGGEEKQGMGAKIKDKLHLGKN